GSNTYTSSFGCPVSDCARGLSRLGCGNTSSREDDHPVRHEDKPVRHDPVYKDYNTCCHDDDIKRVCYFCGRMYDSRELYPDCCYDGPDKDAATRTFCIAVFRYGQHRQSLPGSALKGRKSAFVLLARAGGTIGTGS
ncbi:hypothetical protein FOZ62_028026, partial [Perkinsus olseni]